MGNRSLVWSFVGRWYDGKVAGGGLRVDVVHWRRRGCCRLDRSVATLTSMTCSAAPTTGRGAGLSRNGSTSTGRSDTPSAASRSHAKGRPVEVASRWWSIGVAHAGMTSANTHRTCQSSTFDRRVAGFPEALLFALALTLSKLALLPLRLLNPAGVTKSEKQHVMGIAHVLTLEETIATTGAAAVGIVPLRCADAAVVSLALWLKRAMRRGRFHPMAPALIDAQR